MADDEPRWMVAARSQDERASEHEGTGAASQPRLLARDGGELNEIAERLRDGSRVVAFVVCAPELGEAARLYLMEHAGREIPDAENVTAGTRMVEVLTEAAERTATEVVSVRPAVEADDGRVLSALNWNREKLRRGASVVMWLDDEEALRAVRRLAPDAFSFRDVVIGVEGEKRVEVVPPDLEGVDVRLARTRYAAADGPVSRAHAAAVLAEELYWRDRRGDSLSLLEEALSALNCTGESAEAPLARARVHSAQADTVVDIRRAESQRYVWAGLHALNDRNGGEATELRAWLWSETFSPLGIDAAAVPELERLAQQRVSRSTLLGLELRVCDVLIRKGLLGQAASRLQSFGTSNRLVRHNQGILLAERARLAAGAGAFTDAESLFEKAALLMGRAGTGSALTYLDLAVCAQICGETNAARAVFNQLVNDAQAGIDARLHLLEITLDEGQLSPALRGIEALIQQAASARYDTPLYDHSRAYVDSILRAHDAGALAPTDLPHAEAVLTAAEAVALPIAGDDFPWYRILFPGLRAEILGLRPDRLPEAISLLDASWKLAAAEWQDAAPQHARALVHLLLKAGRLGEAAGVLDIAIPDAIAQRHLRELSRLLAARIAVLVYTGADPASLGAVLAEMRGVLDETNAPRIAAETLLELARLLPATTTAPDPLELLDEAAVLFAEMPIPGQEARCLETAGDVFSARNQPGEAARRYHEAIALLERHGLGLRLPLLRRKVEAAAA